MTSLCNRDDDVATETEGISLCGDCDDTDDGDDDDDDDADNDGDVDIAVDEITTLGELLSLAPNRGKDRNWDFKPTSCHTASVSPQTLNTAHCGLTLLPQDGKAWGLVSLTLFNQT